MPTECIGRINGQNNGRNVGEAGGRMEGKNDATVYGEMDMCMDGCYLFSHVCYL